MAIQNITGLENPTEIAKLLQALIDQKSTINLDNLSPEGQAKFTELQNAINANSNSITTINNELSNKLEAEVLKAQNGYIKFSNEVILQWGEDNIIVGTINEIYTKNILLPISYKQKYITVVSLMTQANWGQVHVTSNKKNLSNIEISLFAHSTIVNNLPFRFNYFSIGY